MLTMDSPKLTQATVDDRPDGHQDEGDDDHHHGGHDRRRRRPEKKASAQCSPTLLKRLYSSAAMTPPQDADELVADLGKGCRYLVGRDTLIWATAPGLSRVVTAGKADQTGQRGGTVFIPLDMPRRRRRTNGHAVDDGGARLDQKRSQGFRHPNRSGQSSSQSPSGSRRQAIPLPAPSGHTADLLQITENVHGSSP